MIQSYLKDTKGFISLDWDHGPSTWVTDPHDIAFPNPINIYGEEKHGWPYTNYHSLVISFYTIITIHRSIC